ncbi:MAG: hypothetical protein WC178_02845 [Candidatus Paceibacterota bacterium]
MDFQNIFGSIEFTTLSWDLFVIVVFIVGIGFYLFRFGKDKAFIALLSSYISFALVSRLELLEKVLGLGLENSFLDKALFFLLGVFVLFFILSRSAFTSVFNRGTGGAWFETLVVSFLQIGFMVSATISFLSILEINNLSIFLRSVFVGDGAQFFWFVTPLLAISLLREK